MESVARSANESPPEEFDRMSLIDHLEELRLRIVRAVIAVAVAFVVCWTFVKPIAEFLARPVYKVLPGQKLAFLGITDPFIMYVKIAALAGLFVASPIVMYIFGTLFFVGGGAFAYYVAFPFAVEFLVGVGSEFDPVITVDRYFRFLLYVILGLGVMFELPIVIFLLAQMGIVTPRFLIRHFRWAVLLIFVAAAFITPTPDVVNLCLFAVPTIFLYLLGVGAAALVQWGKKREQEGV
jgi:sec-independent protein translocase protein TatC